MKKDKQLELNLGKKRNYKYTVHCYKQYKKYLYHATVNKSEYSIMLGVPSTDEPCVEFDSVEEAAKEMNNWFMFEDEVWEIHGAKGGRYDLTGKRIRTDEKHRFTR